MATTNVTKFETPEGTVRISNLIVDSQKKHFTATLDFKPKGKRTFNSQQISGTTTSKLAEYFSKLQDEFIKTPAINERGYNVVPTGRQLTNFQKYLAKRGLDILTDCKDMVFQDTNTSEVYQENPFKVISYLTGKFTLSLVNIKAMNVQRSFNPSTGQTSESYSRPTFVNKDGNVQYSYIIPKYYKRFIVQVQQEVEVLD